MRALAILLFVLFASVANAERCLVVTSLTGEATATTTDQVLLARDDARAGLLIVNKGLVTVYLKIDSAQSGTEGIELPAGGNYEPIETPTGEIHVRASSGTAAIYKQPCHK